MADVIKEFLVALGFRIDENGLSKFGRVVHGATTNVAQLGLQATSTAAAVATAVSKIAQQYDNLYYVSLRTSSSVSSLQTAEQGMKAIGIGYDKTRSTVEGLSRALRLNPGVGGLAGALGIRTQGRETTQILDDLIGRLKKMPFHVAAAFGEHFGIDSDTLFMAIKQQKELTAAKEDYARRQREAGVNTDDLARKSRDLVNAYDRLTTTLGLQVDQVAQKWLPTMKDGVDWLDQVAQAMNRVGKDTDGWSSTIVTLVASLGALKGSAWLLRLLGFSRVAAVVGGAAGGAASTAAATALAPVAAATLVMSAANENKNYPEMKRKLEEDRKQERRAQGGGGKLGLEGATGNVGGGEVTESLQDARLALRAAKPRLQQWFGIEPDANANPASVPGSAAVGKDAFGRTPAGTTRGVVDFFQKMGWDKEAAVAIAANFKKESNFDPRAVGDNGTAFGLAQHRKERADEFKKVFGKDIREASMEENMRFVDYELRKGSDWGARRAGLELQKPGTAGEKAAAFSRLYERPRDVQGEQIDRARIAEQMFRSPSLASPGPAGGDTAVTQRTEIHVHGVTDARGAAGAVYDGQDRVNGDLVRNVKSAVR